MSQNGHERRVREFAVIIGADPSVAVAAESDRRPNIVPRGPVPQSRPTHRSNSEP
jgi:hypothetical protein